MGGKSALFHVINKTIINSCINLFFFFYLFLPDLGIVVIVEPSYDANDSASPGYYLLQFLYT